MSTNNLSSPGYLDPQVLASLANQNLSSPHFPSSGATPPSQLNEVSSVSESLSRGVPTSHPSGLGLSPGSHPYVDPADIGLRSPTSGIQLDSIFSGLRAGRSVNAQPYLNESNLQKSDTKRPWPDS